MTKRPDDLRRIRHDAQGANTEVQSIYAKVQELRNQADSLDNSAAGVIADRFGGLSQRLIELSEDKRYTPIELLQALLDLRAQDPTFANVEINAAQAVRLFAMLKNDTPVLNLANKHTGVVSGSPTNFTIDMTYNNGAHTPEATFGVPLRTVSHDGQEHEQDVIITDSDLFLGFIGINAIAQQIGKTIYSTSPRALRTFSHHLDMQGLTKLRTKIDSLYALGMEPINTTALDEALDRANADEIARKERQRVEEGAAGILRAMQLIGDWRGFPL